MQIFEEGASENVWEAGLSKELLRVSRFGTWQASERERASGPEEKGSELGKILG